ncbi:helix-turn-helix domain-containing protein [Bradyrhizobium stylosanthis]|uniref:helix-turn-helix domain-containing protein n=1 Tax=Bradyrhizobium stylosanthis TaxID=1803665 RepID=UPI003D3214A1
MAGDGSGAYPSYATIAKESGLNRSTVIKHVKLAAEAGLLRIDGRADDDGEQTSNLYTALMPVVAHIDHPSLPRPPLVAQDDPKNPSLTTQLSNPPKSSQPTKASRRGSTPLRSLEEFLSDTGGIPPASFGEYCRKLSWDEQHAGRVWERFARLTKPGCKGRWSQTGLAQHLAELVRHQRRPPKPRQWQWR